MPRLLIVIISFIVLLVACSNGSTDEATDSNETSNDQSQEETQTDESKDTDTPDMLNRDQAREITNDLLTDVHNAMQNYKQEENLNALLNQEAMTEVSEELEGTLQEFTINNGLDPLKDQMMKTYFQPEQNSGVHPDQIDTRFQILDMNQNEEQTQLNISYLTLPDDTHTAAGTYNIVLVQDDNWKISNIDYVNSSDQPFNLDQRDITDLGFQFVETFDHNDQTFIAYQQDGMLMTRNTQTGNYGLDSETQNTDNAYNQSTEEEQSTEDNTENEQNETEETNESEQTESNNESDQQQNEDTNQSSDLAHKYHKKLNQTQQRVDDLVIPENATTGDLTDYESKRIDQWDTLLNNIYGALESHLSSGEMEQLREEQRQWITERDNRAEGARDEAGNGTLGNVYYKGSIADTTKERCYELVNQYME